MKSKFELFKDREFLGDKLLDVIFTHILLEKGYEETKRIILKNTF